jgi:DNA (cytosine-5)-methyltransferase 1
MQGGNRQPKIVMPVLTPDRLEKRQNGRRFKDDGEPSFTVTAQDQHGVFDGMKIRRLTPVECERLQGFPDDWTKYGEDGKVMSDTSRYKACGNAVTTNVITVIASRLLTAPLSRG